MFDVQGLSGYTVIRIVHISLDGCPGNVVGATVCQQMWTEIPSLFQRYIALLPASDDIVAEMQEGFASPVHFVCSWGGCIVVNTVRRC